MECGECGEYGECYIPRMPSIPGNVVKHSGEVTKIKVN